MIIRGNTKKYYLIFFSKLTKKSRRGLCLDTVNSGHLIESRQPIGIKHALYTVLQ